MSATAIRPIWGDLIYAMRNHGFDIQIVKDAEFEQAVKEYAAAHEDSEAVSGLIAYASREEENMVYVYAIDIRVLPAPKENPALLRQPSSRRRRKVVKYLRADDRKRARGNGRMFFSSE